MKTERKTICLSIREPILKKLDKEAYKKGLHRNQFIEWLFQIYGLKQASNNLN